MSNEITRDNIRQVLEFNKSLGLEVDNIRIEDNCICFNCRGGSQEFEFDDDGGTKWLQHTEIETGKLKPLPKANPFDMVGFGCWVRSLVDDEISRVKGEWYQRSPDTSIRSELCYIHKRKDSSTLTESVSSCPTSWDLTNIRDYDPTECELKIGDKIITKNGYGHELCSFSYSNEILYLGNGAFSINFKNINKVIESVNGRKYDKITIPKFDFVKCLVDAGFLTGFCGDTEIGNYKFLYKNKINVDIYPDGRFNFIDYIILPTPANAQILIEMAKLSEGLK